MLLSNLWIDERGQGSAEYGLLLAAVVVLVVVAATMFTEDLQSLFTSIGTYINGALV
jgi:Flp pilus assembly pilin Flp